MPRLAPSFLRNIRWFLLVCAALPGSLAVASWWNPWEKKPASPPKAALLGEGVRIRFSGAKSFSEKRMRQAIEEPLRQIRAEGLTRANADDAAYYLSAFFQDQGFASAEVQWEIRPQELRLNIREGTACRLRSVQVSGNRALSTPEVLAILKSPTTDRFQGEPPNFPFVMDDLQRGCGRVVDWYQAEGFLNADVEGPEVRFSKDSTEAEVSIEIREGQRYSFAEPRFEGELAYPRATVREALASQLRAPYTAANLTGIESTLREFYTRRAHFEASVEALADPAEADAQGKVPLLIRVKAGPTYQFQGMQVQGLTRLRTEWMRARLLSLENQPYSPESLEAKTRRLMASGLFESLEIRPEPQPNRTLRLQVNAREAKARELGFSTGYGSYEGFMLGTRAWDRNLFGRGVQGGVDLSFSQRSISVEGIFSNPWLFETQTQFVTRVFIRNRIELGYDKREAGIRGELSRRIETSRRLFDWLHLSPFTQNPLQVGVYGQTRTVEITASDIAPKYLGKTAYQIATVGVSATLDERDNALNPTRGWLLAGLLDTNTLENGNSFLRTSGRVGWHYPLPGGIGFAVSGRFGILSQQSSPPIDERFFLGGPTTVRSFRERKLGIRDSQGFPIGGSAYTLANAEADFPLWQSLRGALFFDAGSLAEDGERAPVSHFRKAVGVGLRYALPVGPLRLDLGFNPDRKPNESWGAAHVSFGFAF